MSEGGGEPVKNGVVEASILGIGDAPTVKCPEVNFSPYDEHGRPKPNVCICPPKLPVPGEEQIGEESSNGPDKPSSGDSKEITQEETKEQDDAKPSASPAPSSPAHASPAPSSPAPTSPAHTSPAPGSPAPSAEPGSPSADSKKSFSEQFKLFSKFGDIKSDGRLLSLSQSDKWMKQAKVIDGKHITTTDTGIHFKKHKSIKLSETEYKKFIEELAKSKKMNSEDIKKKMIGCGPPGFTSSSSAKTPGAFERLTDTSKYTGSHRQRFDETGKGRGIAGRKDLHDTSGYVSGYNNKNTYDKKNPTK